MYRFPGTRTEKRQRRKPTDRLIDTLNEAEADKYINRLGGIYRQTVRNKIKTARHSKVELDWDKQSFKINSRQTCTVDCYIRRQTD